MQAMILAAGLGTRLKPYSLLRPKPLFPVLNRPLLARIVEQLRLAGCETMVVNTHHLGEQISALLASAPDIILQPEATILGTGGGLCQARRHFTTDAVLVVNGDIYHTIDLAWVVAEHRRLAAISPQWSPVSLVLHDCQRFNGVAVDEELRVLGFAGYSDPLPATARRLAFTGIHVIDPAILQRIPALSFYNIIDCYRELIRENIPIGAILAEGHLWSDIGTPADYLGLHEELLRGGLSPADSNDPAILIHAEARLGQGVGLHHWACVGANAEVGAGAELTRVVVWDGARVEPGARLKDTIVV